jgi:hypothetical protein
MNQKTKDFIKKEIARQLSIHPGGLVYTSDPATYEQDEKVWPQDGDEVWYVDPLGYLKDFVYTKGADVLLKKLRAQGNAFPTEEEAKAHSLRQKAMANTWKPEEEENYHFWNFKEKRTHLYRWEGDDFDFVTHFLGNCHPTKEEAKEWGEKYHNAFMKKIK